MARIAREEAYGEIGDRFEDPGENGEIAHPPFSGRLDGLEEL